MFELVIIGILITGCALYAGAYYGIQWLLKQWK
jgi:hypothetical protein